MNNPSHPTGNAKTWKQCGSCKKEIHVTARHTGLCATCLAKRRAKRYRGMTLMAKVKMLEGRLKIAVDALEKNDEIMHNLGVKSALELWGDLSRNNREALSQIRSLSPSQP